MSPTPATASTTSPAPAPPPKQVSDIGKAEAAALDRWLQMFTSTQSFVNDNQNPDGSNYAATATIAISDISKVGGQAMTSADLASGVLGNQGYIIAAFRLHDNAPNEPFSGHIPDINATVELRQVVAAVAPSESLSAAEQANGITYKGSVGLSFISRYLASSGATPAPYRDDGYGFSVVIQSGQAQLAPLDSTLTHLSLTTKAGVGMPIYYPAAAFTRAEECARQGGDPATSCGQI